MCSRKSAKKKGSECHVFTHPHLPTGSSARPDNRRNSDINTTTWLEAKCMFIVCGCACRLLVTSFSALRAICIVAQCSWGSRHNVQNYCSRSSVFDSFEHVEDLNCSSEKNERFGQQWYCIKLVSFSQSRRSVFVRVVVCIGNFVIFSTEHIEVSITSFTEHIQEIWFCAQVWTCPREKFTKFSKLCACTVSKSWIQIHRWEPCQRSGPRISPSYCAW